MIKTQKRGDMFQVAEGIKGIHILGVCENRRTLENLLDICPMNPKSRYVLLEVGMNKETVQDVLAGLGIQGTMTGAQYLHDAVTIALADYETIERITKLMYPKIARMHFVTAAKVERAIRVAIERSWPTADMEYKRKIFGNLALPGHDRPTNTEYIEMIVNYLK